MKYCFIWKDSGAVVNCRAIFNSIDEAAAAKKKNAKAKHADLIAIAACYTNWEIGYNHRSAPSVRRYRQYTNREIALLALWAMEADPKTYGMPILREYVAGVLD